MENKHSEEVKTPTHGILKHKEKSTKHLDGVKLPEDEKGHDIEEKYDRLIVESQMEVIRSTSKSRFLSKTRI